MEEACCGRAAFAARIARLLKSVHRISAAISANPADSPSPFLEFRLQASGLKKSPQHSKLALMQSVFTGPVYVVRDNIDTDQIIPAQYLNLVPTIPEEYEKLGAYALCGLPESSYPSRYVADGQLESQYPIVIGGRNFGCGSSREHAPIALGSAGCKVVLAESFA